MSTFTDGMIVLYFFAFVFVIVKVNEFHSEPEYSKLVVEFIPAENLKFENESESGAEVGNPEVRIHPNNWTVVDEAYFERQFYPGVLGSYSFSWGGLGEGVNNIKQIVNQSPHAIFRVVQAGKWNFESG